MHEISSDADLAAAAAGDNATFTRLVAPLRAELHAHCYRMLGSTHDADDALQDALVRAWQALAQLAHGAALRSWLYTVATRSCLDLVAARGRRALPIDLGPASEHAVLDAVPRTDVAWLGPYPDASLPPAARYEEREAVELAFVAALQHLPGNQRAALLLFEVLGFTVAEIAEMMATSTASVNSALQRARATMAAKAPGPSQGQTLRKLDDEQLKRIVTGFADSLARRDADALVALLTEDVTWAMPPLPAWYRGVAAVMDFAVAVPLTLCPGWHYELTGANGQPAVAFYVLHPGRNQYLAWGITVLGLRGERIAELTSFLGAEHFTPFGLPGELPAN